MEVWRKSILSTSSAVRSPVSLKEVNNPDTLSTAVETMNELEGEFVGRE